MLSLWEKRTLLAKRPGCQRRPVSSHFLNVHKQNSCGGAPSFLLLWLWLLTWLGCNILLRGKSGGMQEGGGCRDGSQGWLLPACSRGSPSWVGGVGTGESQFSAGSLWRKDLKYLLIHLSVGGLLLSSCISPCCSSCLVGEKRIFVGSPGFNPRQFSFPASAFHLCFPLAGERSCTWAL